MQDIRLVDNDGEYLNLETQGGEKFRLVLDDSLRSAIKRDAQLQLDSVSISPREIQDEVRAGSSAAEVAAKHSVPLDYVDKFALTVVDEIGHIIASAQTVRISVEADRYSEATQVEFGEVLEGRLRNLDGSNAKWSATKLEGAPWMVSVSFDSPQGKVVATWSFDQRKLILSPENEKAVKLSAGDFAAATAASKLRQVEPSIEATQVIELPSPGISREDSAAEPVDYVAPVVAISSIEELTRSSLQTLEDSAALEESEQLSPTADLLEALRKKRANVNSTAPLEEASVVEDIIAVEEVSPAPIIPAAKKGRPSMPSWDEIVFGTKADD